MAGPYALRQALGYKKFKGKGPYRLIVPLSGYHLQQECLRALTSLGHTVLGVPIGGLSCGETLRALLTASVQFKPDALLAINHLGFDDGHQLGGLLEACALPVAVWYCDSPLFVLKNGGIPAQEMTSLFVWEKTLAATMKGLGAMDVQHLPLACEPRSWAAHAPPMRPITFVGNSMRQACEEWLAPLNAHERRHQKHFETTLNEAHRLQLAPHVAELQKQHPSLRLWDALGAATFRATRSYRDGLLSAVSHHGLEIFGDAGWRGALHSSVLVHPPVTYGGPLAEVYASSAINLNATSLQMPTAVNQRVFDIPASGGFVLSDDQEDIHDLFDVGHEAITYKNAAHLDDLIQTYQAEPKLRQNIVQMAQRRIARCHTFAHRMSTVVNHLAGRHGGP